MRNNKNLGLLVAIMMLSIANINMPVYSVDKVDTAENQSLSSEEIKANKETLEKASNAILNKDYQSAIVYLTAYINNKPKKYEVYKMRGEAFYALRQYRLAQNDFQTAIELKSADDKFITGTKVLSAVVLGADKQDQYQNPELGNLYGELMYAQKALNNPAYESTYQKAFQYNSHIYLPQPKKDDIAKINCPQKYGKVLNPQGVDSYIYGAISDIEKGKFNEAAYKTQYITSNYPKYYLGYYLTGVAMAGLEQEQDAIVAFESALKANPYDFESFASLGQIYYSEAEKTFSKESALKSIDYFNKALKYNPNCYIYHFYIGLNQLQLGDYDKAISSFDSAIKFKTNDYNSMYYKLIAQQLKGDYTSVVEGATKLLYRHVSNYNSVLYLRALAYFKSGNSDAAIADLEKIHNNMNDIYNVDVKSLSKKEMTLAPYLYYLKAQILQQRGFGAKVDLAKAYQNPIIALLSKGNGFENSSLKIPAVDVEEQYDYIRTTFGDLRVSFEYTNPDYKLVSMDSKNVEVTSIVENKEEQGSKAQEQSILADAGTNSIETSTLKKSTDPMDMISTDNQISIAQMLASQSLNVSQNQNNNSSVGIDDVVKTAEVVSSQVEVKTSTIEEGQNVEKEVSKESEQNLVANSKPKKDDAVAVEKEKAPEPEMSAKVSEFDPDTIVFVAPEQKQSDSFEIKYEETKSEPEVKESTSKIENLEFEEGQTNLPKEQNKDEPEQAPIKVVADEIKDSQNFEISYNTEQKQEIVTEEKSEQETTQKDVNEQVKPTEQIKKSNVVTIAKMPTVIKTENEDVNDSKIAQQEPPVSVESKKPVVVEKHANVDLKEFNVPNAKAPEIRDDDEVVVLEPKSFIQNAENKLANESFNLNTNRITDNFAQVKQEDAVVETKTTIHEESKSEPEIILAPAVEADAVSEHSNIDLVDPDKILIANQKEDEAQNEQAEVVEDDNAHNVVTTEPTSSELGETLDNTKVKAKKEKRVKVKKEKTLDDILVAETEVAKTKSKNEKKIKQLKDNNALNIEQPAQADNVVADKNELKEFLNDNQNDIQSEKNKQKKIKKDKQKSKHEESVESILRSVGLTPVEAEEIVENGEQIPPTEVTDNSENIDNKGHKLKPEKKSKYGLFFKRNNYPEEEIITKDISGVTEVVEVPQEQTEIPTQNVEQKNEKVKKSWFAIFKKSKKSDIEQNAIDEEKLIKAPETEVVEDIEENLDKKVEEVETSSKKQSKVKMHKVDKTSDKGITTLPGNFKVNITDEEKKELEKGELKPTPVIRMDENGNLVEEPKDNSKVKTNTKKSNSTKEPKIKVQKDKKSFSFKSLFKKKSKVDK